MASGARNLPPQLRNEYHEPVHIAVIGGTGLQSLPNLEHAATLTDIQTPWGAPSSPITILLHHHQPQSESRPPTPIAFLSRHGVSHQIAPHEVPSRANIAALRSLGVRCIIAFSAVGSLREHIKPRDFVIPGNVIDRTKGIRPFTFFEGGWVAHVGFSDPFDVALTHVIGAVGKRTKSVKVHHSGDDTLVCMEGPQFSTRAESHMYRHWGGDVINMSALPEAKLAREAEMAYAMICMATDYDCWRSKAPKPVEMPAGTVKPPMEDDVGVQTVMAHMKANSENANTFLGAVLDELAKDAHGPLVRGEHLKGQTMMAAGVTGEHGRSQEAKDKIGWLFPTEHAPFGTFRPGE